jgi:hypothetical protein
MAASQNNWASLIWSQAGRRLGQQQGPAVEGRGADGDLAAGRLPARAWHHGLLWGLIIARMIEGGRPLREVGEAALGQRFLRQGADGLGGLHGLRPRPERRAEDDGHHRAGALRRAGRRHAGQPAGMAAFLHPDGGKDDIDTWIIAHLRAGDGGRHRAGGWRIIKTLGHKMVKLHPIHGFAAETSSATILVTLAAHFGMPVSTTHSISTAIMGVGFAKNPRAQDRGDRADRVGLDPHHPGRGRHRLRALAADRRTGLGLIRHGLVERKSRPVAGFFHAGCTGMRVRAGRHSPTSCVPSRRRCRRSPAPGGRSRPHPRSRTGGSRTIAGRARHRVRRWPGSPRGFPS